MVDTLWKLDELMLNVKQMFGDGLKTWHKIPPYTSSYNPYGPISRVIIPSLTHLFLAIYRGPIANTIFNNDRLGSHLKSLKIQASRLHHSRGYERRTTLGSCSTGGLDNGRMG